MTGLYLWSSIALYLWSSIALYLWSSIALYLWNSIWLIHSVIQIHIDVVAPRNGSIQSYIDHAVNVLTQ